MITRYTRPELRTLWSEETKFQAWKEVEVALVQALEARAVAPSGSAKALEAQAVPTPAAVSELERTLDHDVIAFLTLLAEGMGPEREWVHYGMTSSDLVDTAQALRVIRSLDVIAEGVDRALDRSRELALRHRRTPIVGRTHGVHAEPMVVGLKFLGWYAELRRDRERLTRARETMRCGKLSGAVGTCAHLSPEVESDVLTRLGLATDPVSTQVISRDRHAELFGALAIVAGSLERFATEIRHLHRTEVREISEGFRAGQKGSSAMPHKRNPITSERITGLARIVRGNTLAAFENMALWHERDISHSSVERVILPDTLCLVDYMLDRFCDVLGRLEFDEARMQANLESTSGLVFSGHVLLALTRALHDRERAYAIVQGHALACWQEGGRLVDRLVADPEVRSVLSESDVRALFDVHRVLGHVDAIFERTLS
jgi:adenylosuccinate lyase